MQDSSLSSLLRARRLIPIFLLGYNFLALNSLKHFGIQEYDYLKFNQLSSEISLSVRTNESNIIPYCPPIIEFAGRAWEKIKHYSNFWREEERLPDFDEKSVAKKYGLVKAGFWRPKKLVS